MSSSNPYDFEKPVRNPKLFAGRRETLEEVDYYLGLATVENPTFHNLSLIGQRAAGKSSLLNMIQHMAEKKGYLSVKLSLNNETSSNEVLLFKDILDGLMTAGAEKGMFDGLAGKAYKAFRRVMDMLDAEVEIPLLFGTAYIGAKTKGTATITQHVLANDLKKIHTEAKNHGILAIALLLDECDLLAANQTLLQKLRNVFSDIDGYILVFSGTENMFPSMEQVFSPLPRFFKRIDVENFRKIEDTRECVINRLSDEEKKLVNDATILEIQNITNGSPYEVQLVSHFMYRTFKEKRTQNIAITTEVLDKVLNEIERLRKAGHHQIANEIKRCNRQQLDILKGILEFPNSTRDRLSTFLLLSELDSTNLNDMGHQKSFLGLLIDDMVGRTIIEKEGKFNLAGDQFDLLYLKYHLLSNGITDFIAGNPDQLDNSMQHKLATIFLKDIPSYITNTRFDNDRSGKSIVDHKMSKLSFGGKFPAKPGAKPGEWVKLFEFSMEKIQKDFYEGVPNSFRFRANIDFLEMGFVEQYKFDDEEHLKVAKQRIELLMTKLGFLGVKIILKDEIEWTLQGINLAERGKLQDSLNCYEEAIRINPQYELVWANKGMALFTLGQYENALKCFNTWSAIRPSLPQPWEEQGKCLIHLKRSVEAILFLDKSVNLGPERWSAWDNRGRALLNVKKYKEAIDSFDKAISLAPHDYDAMALRAICNAALGNDSDALESLEKILSIKPDHKISAKEKIRILRGKADYSKAIEEVQKLKQFFTDDAEVMMLESLVLDDLNRRHEAIAICDKVLSKYPNETIAWFIRSCFTAKNGNNAEAIRDLKRALEIDREQIVTLVNEEKDLDSIRNDEDFKKLMSEEQT